VEPARPVKTDMNFLGRSRKIILPDGSKIRTPILIPSFSSRVGKYSCEEVKGILHYTSELFTDSLLLSAYDIYHEVYSGPDSLAATPELYYIDSGGYEASMDRDLSTTHPAFGGEPCQRTDRSEWTFERYREITAKICSANTEKNIAVVNYDHHNERFTIEEQLEKARQSFEGLSGILRSILLKPEMLSQKILQIDKIVSKASSLREFDIIGVTEKELGESVLNRLCNLAKIRMALDREDVLKPVHVFGCLDPLSCSLYFMAGAEIFDGLTWMRFAFMNGGIVYSEQYRLINALDDFSSVADKRMFQGNLDKLRELKDHLISYHNSGNFKDIGEADSDLLEKVVDRVRARLRS
jgi:hypothetical protein